MVRSGNARGRGKASAATVNVVARRAKEAGAAGRITVETCRWCTSCTTANALSAVGSGAVDLRAKWTCGADATAQGGALGRRGGESVEVETAVALLRASRCIAQTTRHYTRTHEPVTHAHCRRLAISFATKCTSSTHRPTIFASDVQVK